jgi:hypothetical protein
MCICIPELVKLGILQPNLLDSHEFFIYPIKNNKIVKTPMLINFCPVCGLKVSEL